MTKVIVYVGLIGIVLTSMGSSEHVSYAQNFYAGKTIRIVVIKSKLDVDPMSGEQVENIVAGLFKLDSATVAKMSEILK
jgi:hypothetical protein